MSFLSRKKGNILFAFLQYSLSFQRECMKEPFDNQMMNLKEESVGGSYLIILEQSYR